VSTATLEKPDADAKGGDTKGKGKGKEKSGKSNLVPAIVLAVGIAVGGYFMGGSGTPACTGKDCAAAEAKAEEKPPGQIATMDPLSVNLADEHFLKVGVAVQLAEGIEASEFAKGDISKVKDMLIDLLAGEHMEVLQTPEGRAKIKEELKKRSEKAFEGNVLDVYFTDFVMQ